MTVWNSGGPPAHRDTPAPSAIASSLNYIAILCGVGVAAVLAPMLYAALMAVGLEDLLIDQWDEGTFMLWALKVLMGFVCFGVTVFLVRLVIVGTFIGGALAATFARR